MAVDMFLKLDGIKGESKDASHKGEIDILSWSWGLSQAGTTHMGGGGGAGKVNVQDISFTKYIEKSTPELMLACCNGKHIREATLTVRKAGETPLEYLKVKFTDLIVSSIAPGGSGGEDRLMESLTLNFSKFEFEYQEQGADGKPVGGPVKAGWNIAENKKV